MNSSLVFVLALILAYTGVFFIFKRERLTLLAGFEFLFIGYILYFQDFDASTLKPLLYPFLCWMGMLIGLQMRFSDLKKLPKSLYTTLISFTLLTIIIPTGLFYLIGFSIQSVVMAIACCSICYRNTAHYITNKERHSRFVLFLISAIPFASIIALLLFYIGTDPIRDIGITLVFIVVSSILSRALLTSVQDKNSVILLLIGLILLVSETCAVFDVSALVVGFFVGIYLTNTCIWKTYIFRVVYHNEKQLFMVFLILLGLMAGLKLELLSAARIPAVVLTVLAVRYFILKFNFIAGFNYFYFVAPGGFALVILTDFWLKQGGIPGTLWFSEATLSIVILQLIGVLFSRQVSQ